MPDVFRRQNRPVAFAHHVGELLSEKGDVLFSGLMRAPGEGHGNALGPPRRRGGTNAGADGAQLFEEGGCRVSEVRDLWGYIVTRVADGVGEVAPPALRLAEGDCGSVD